MEAAMVEDADGLEMVDAAGVAHRLRRWVPLGGRLAQSWSEAGRIVGRREGQRMLYPLCQFDTEGLPLPQMHGVIAALRPWLSETEIVAWLGTPCPDLSGSRPAECLSAMPDAVLHAARRAADPARVVTAAE
ncbi:hypothetical protein T8T21_09900 [Limimaricola variabilis]|uniref:hypothetical protein n=1 Tax=Limimaricola variabilis TaxID=1492771 RepID=UPI002AC955A7|nr:hypothetical protein [Limimaricola variabilis]WPY93436.1 hypothetical protein T8T21_09900 [Limimaricola variabilis]